MKAYIANSKNNNKVFRVTIPSGQIKDLKLYPKPQLVERKMGRKESVVDEDLKTIYTHEQLRNGVDELIDNI